MDFFRLVVVVVVVIVVVVVVVGGIIPLGICPLEEGLEKEGALMGTGEGEGEEGEKEEEKGTEEEEAAFNFLFTLFVSFLPSKSSTVITI